MADTSQYQGDSPESRDQEIWMQDDRAIQQNAWRGRERAMASAHRDAQPPVPRPVPASNPALLKALAAEGAKRIAAQLEQQRVERRLAAMQRQVESLQERDRVREEQLRAALDEVRRVAQTVGLRKDDGPACTAPVDQAATEELVRVVRKAAADTFGDEFVRRVTATAPDGPQGAEYRIRVVVGSRDETPEQAADRLTAFYRMVADAADPDALAETVVTVRFS